MATYTVQKISRSGVTVTYAAVASSDDFPNDGKTILIVDNGDASPVNVTFDLAVDPHADEPTQSSSATNVAVTNGDVDFIGPFPTNKFGSSVTVNYSGTTSITAAAVSIA